MAHEGTEVSSSAEQCHAAPLQHVHLQSMSRSVEHFTGDWARDRFDLSPPYQRGSVWDGQRRRNLIRSLLLGVPIGSIILNSRGYETEVSYAIVDGKQRIETLRGFVDGEFAVPAWWFEAANVNGPREGEIDFSGLSVRGQRGFRQFLVSTCEAAVKTVAQEAEIYRLINTGGVDQTAETLAAAAEIENSDS